jgi:hypothetical protein
MDMFCTYLTIYSGNKLPPFYIGVKSIVAVLNGYHGSVESHDYKSIWKSELKENPQLFKTVILTEHNTFEEAKEKEEYFQTFHQAHTNPLFINRHIGHKMFFNKGGYQLSEKTKAKISASTKGKPKSPYNRKSTNRNPHTEETRTKISQSLRGQICSDVTKDKISKSNSKQWIVTYPDGSEMQIANMAKFCRENNLHKSNFLQRGHCKGFIIKPFFQE